MKTFTLTVWERAVLSYVIDKAPDGYRTELGVRTIHGIHEKLELTDDEKEDVGYVDNGDGTAGWDDKEYEADIKFTDAECLYIGASPRWGGWPTSRNSYELCITLWDQIKELTSRAKE